MNFRNQNSTQEYIKYINQYNRISEEDIPIYCHHSKVSPEYIKLIILKLGIYPMLVSEKSECSERKKQITNEYKSWCSYLAKSYKESGINCNDLIRFVDWSLHYACEAAGLKLPNNTQIGTCIYPFPSINVQCQIIDNNNFLILVPPGCIAILEKFSRLMFSDNLVDNITDELFDIVKDYTENNVNTDFNKTNFDAKRPDIEELKTLLFIHSLFFVLLHEYAHIVNNHVSLNKAVVADSNDVNSDEDEDIIFYTLNNEQSFTVLFKNTFQEYEADSWSVFCLSRILNLWDSSPESLLSKKFSMASPVLFLGIAQAIEESDLISGERNNLDAHPPAFDRLTITDMVFSILGDEWTNEERKFIGMYVNAVVHKISDSPGGSSINSLTMWWKIFDFMLSLDNDLLIPEFLWDSLDLWSNPNIETIEKTTEEMRNRINEANRQ